MQILGAIILTFVVWYGFAERDMTRITAFDARALIMVLLGSFAAVLISSTTKNVLRTLASLRELLPGTGKYRKETDQLEAERNQFTALWLEGKRGQAVELAEKSEFSSTNQMLQLLISRSPKATIESRFVELKHDELSKLQPAANNWELLARLGPAFGMVGTITGMILLFRNMAESDLNLGAAMSLALLSTLYGVVFGAGLAGPVGKFLNNMLDERLGALERCEQSVYALLAQAGGR